jgi:uncharacterized protein
VAKTSRSSRRADLTIGEATIGPGENRDVRLKVSESYTGDPIAIPMRIIRANRSSSGPVLFITGAVHGDEINGTGIIRQLMFGGLADRLAKGTLVLVPVVNSFGFESHSRYLPDRRDLNRSFPGSPRGSLASRLADIFFQEVISKCDFGIDLHTAAVRRTNYPNVRADLSSPGVKRIAEAFGCELIVNERGPEGSLRREACRIGCPTIILEAGEVWKIEPSVVTVGVNGVRNVMIELGMIDGEIVRPPYQTRIDKTMWVRAELGGILSFHVAPGDIVQAGQPIATNVSVIGDAQSILISPADGIILGMATLPAVKPGEPVVHIAVPRKKLSVIRKGLAKRTKDHIDHQLRKDLASNITVYPTDMHDAHWPEVEL